MDTKELLNAINEAAGTTVEAKALLAWLETEGANGVRYDSPTQFAEAIADAFNFYEQDGYDIPEEVFELAEYLLEPDDEPEADDPDDTFEIQMQRDAFDFGTRY